MESNKKLLATRFISIGLLLVTVPFLIKEYVKIPDFFRGFFTGIGLALEIIGLIIMTKAKRSAKNTPESELIDKV
jgi:hypothetical protein